MVRNKFIVLVEVSEDVKETATLQYIKIHH